MRAAVAGQTTLRDGRVLAYAEYGAPDGIPLLYFHGFPSCSTEAALAHRVARGLHVRIVAVDRPGFGRSTFLEDRRIGDWPADVVELADALGLDRVSVIGVSGGGPYALACAAAIPERLRAVGVVSGLGPAHARGAIRGMAPLNRLLFRLGRRAPWIVRAAYRTLSDVVLRDRGRLRLRLAPSLSEADRRVFQRRDVLDTLLGSFRAAGQQGGRGIAWELSRFNRPWDFEIERITLPVRLWHGQADRVVPWAMGRRVAHAVPGCRARFFPDEGHFSLIVGHMEPILRELMDGARLD